MNTFDSSSASKRFPTTTLLALGLVAGGYALKTVLAARARIEFGGKTVVITGGSRGLGLELARGMVRDGANVALLARDGAELGRARDELLSIAQGGAQVLSVVCDLRDESSVTNAVARIARHFGGIDVLVNDAGIIQVGPLEHMTLQDFEDALDINLRGAIRMTLACLPHLKGSARKNAGHGGARIINITSFGGVVAVPHMAPYAASKFGFVGFSDAIRSELHKDGVRVLTVIPGTLRTGSHVHAQFKGQHAKEYASFAATASAPVVTMDSPAAATTILEAARRGDNELILPAVTRLMVLGVRLSPGITASVLKLMARVMPGPTDGAGDVLKTGEDARQNVPDALSAPADRASDLNNERQSAQNRVLADIDGAQLNGTHPALAPDARHDSDS